MEGIGGDDHIVRAILKALGGGIALDVKNLVLHLSQVSGEEALGVFKEARKYVGVCVRAKDIRKALKDLLRRAAWTGSDFEDAHTRILLAELGSQTGQTIDCLLKSKAFFVEPVDSVVFQQDLTLLSKKRWSQEVERSKFKLRNGGLLSRSTTLEQLFISGPYPSLYCVRRA